MNKLADAISMIQDDNLVMNFYGSGESEQYNEEAPKRSSYKLLR